MPLVEPEIWKLTSTTIDLYSHLSSPVELLLPKLGFWSSVRVDMVLWRWAASSSRCSLIDTASSIASKRNPLGLNRGTKDHHLLQVSAARRELNMTATQRIFSVQQDCLHDSLHDTCKWGATPAYGR